MDKDLILKHFPDFNFWSIVGSGIPRLEIPFQGRSVRIIQHDLKKFFEVIFSQDNWYMFHAAFPRYAYTNKLNKADYGELEILWRYFMNRGYRENLTFSKYPKGGVYYYDFSPINHDFLQRMLIIDACGYAKNHERHGIPFIFASNFYLNYSGTFLVNIWNGSGITVASYDLKFLSQIQNKLREIYNVELYLK